MLAAALLMSDGYTVYILKRLECEQLPLLLSHQVSYSLYKLHFYYQRNVSLPPPPPPAPRSPPPVLPLPGTLREGPAPGHCPILSLARPPAAAPGSPAKKEPRGLPAQQDLTWPSSPHLRGDPLTAEMLESFPMFAGRQGTISVSLSDERGCFLSRLL